MVDVFNKRKRSAVMAAIRSKGNNDTELRVRRILIRHKITGWRRQLPLPGKPDFTFRKQRAILFIDGCYWHGCPVHGHIPKSNTAYWLKKIRRNKERDSRVSRLLRKGGWRVMRIWEHALVNEDRLAERIQKFLNRA